MEHIIKNRNQLEKIARGKDVLVAVAVPNGDFSMWIKVSQKEAYDSLINQLENQDYEVEAIESDYEIYLRIVYAVTHNHY